MQRSVHPMLALLVFVIIYLLDVFFFRLSAYSSWAVLAVLTVVLSLVLPLAATALSKVSLSDGLLLSHRFVPGAAVSVVVATVLLVPLYICFNLILARHWPEVRSMIYGDARQMRQMVRTTSWPLIAAGGLFFAFTEEFLYRGFLMNALRRWGDAVALIISSICFAVAHHSVGKLLPMTLAGMWFGFVALRTRSIWVSTAAHFAVNAGLLAAIMYLAGPQPLRRTPLPEISDWWLVALVPFTVGVVWLSEKWGNATPGTSRR